jgi:signal transduction histidine kinase
MAGFRVHIDLPGKEDAAAFAGMVGELGGSAYLSMENSIPEILITDKDRLGSQPYLGTPALIPPRVLVVGRPDEVTASRLLGLQISAFLEPETARAVLPEALRAAVAELTSIRKILSQYHDIERRYRELSTVVSLTGEMALEFDIDQLLESIVSQISEDLGYSIVSIMLLDEDNRNMSIRASRGLSDHIVNSSRVEVGKGVAGSVASTGEPLLIRDIEKDPRFGKNRSHGRYSSKSLICVPLKVRDRVIGVLNGNNRKSGGQLGEHDLRLLTLFASQASLNIERARLYRNLENQAAELKSAYDTLQETDRLKSDFITNVSHEYRTPVTIILGYLELLKGSLEGDENLSKVETTIEAAMKLSSMIDDSTDLLKMDTDNSPFNFRAVNAELFMAEAVRFTHGRFNAAGIELVMELEPDTPRVLVDPEKMYKVFEKLLDNALKFTPAGGRVRLGGFKDGESALTLFVEDTGPGIPEADRERIFERFEQSGDIMTEKPMGTGLGLPIVKAIATRQDGAVRVDPDYVDGCRILVTVPVASEAQAGSEEGTR